MTVSRRHALQAGAVAVTGGLAGCAGVFGPNCTHSARLEFDRATDDAVAAAATAGRYADLGPLSGRLLEAAFRTGETTHRAHRPAVREGVYGTPEGYYRVAVTAVEEAPAPRYDVEFTASTDATPGDAVAFGSLPDPDRRALLVSLVDRLARRRRGGIDVSGRMPLVYDEAGVAASRLVPEAGVDRVRYDDVVLTVTPTGETSSATLQTFRFAAERLAGSTAAFADLAREELLARGGDVAPADLTADQREVVETAIEEGYGECVDDPSPAFAGVVEALFGDVDVRYGGADDELVTYDGTAYLGRYVVAVA